MRDLSVEELAEWRTAGRDFILLDVREHDEVRTAAIPGAMHVPLREVPARAGGLRKDAEIVVMCHHGGRSERVAHFLESQGFDAVHNLEGGIDAWSLRVDPAVTRY